MMEGIFKVGCQSLVAVIMLGAGLTGCRTDETKSHHEKAGKTAANLPASNNDYYQDITHGTPIKLENSHFFGNI